MPQSALLLGSGYVATPTVEVLANASVHVTVASRTLASAQKLAGSFPKHQGQALRTAPHFASPHELVVIMNISVENSQASGLESKVLALEKQTLGLEQKHWLLLPPAQDGEGNVKETNEATEEPSKPQDAPKEDQKTHDEDIHFPFLSYNYYRTSQLTRQQIEFNPHSRVKIIKTITNPATGERAERQADATQSRPDENGKYVFTLKKTTKTDK
ncbi:hypothetical protein PT974_12227 [Cladobotryum mycophilum]|uniref:Pyrroline-5-carboxylate reductase catalytic N-terminal domain-containing protein n=1 Tax=Cladobotryum mycophilum TaxID=491253 RepID=A0ABR0S7E2_9HYPO